MIKEIVTKIRIFWAVLTAKIFEINYYDNYWLIEGFGLRIYKYETRGQKQFWLVYDGKIEKIPVYGGYNRDLKIYKSENDGAFISISDKNFFINLEGIKPLFPRYILKGYSDEFWFFYDEKFLLVYDEIYGDRIFQEEVEDFKFIESEHMLFICQNKEWRYVRYSADNLLEIDENVRLARCPEDTNNIQIIGNMLIRLEDKQVLKLGEYDSISEISWLGKNTYFVTKSEKAFIVDIDEENKLWDFELSGSKIIPITCIGDNFVRYFITENKTENKVSVYEVKDVEKPEIEEVITYDASEIKFDKPFFDKETGEFISKVLFYVPLSTDEM